MNTELPDDAKLWVAQTMGNDRCSLKISLCVITVSLETNKIVAGLPGLEI